MAVGAFDDAAYPGISGYDLAGREDLPDRDLNVREKAQLEDDVEMGFSQMRFPPKFGHSAGTRYCRFG